jgi:hypothetical protein
MDGVGDQTRHVSYEINLQNMPFPFFMPSHLWHFIPSTTVNGHPDLGMCRDAISCIYEVCPSTTHANQSEQGAI